MQAAEKSEKPFEMKRPNILIIQTDEQSYWTLGCYGQDLYSTPNIDSLAKEGVVLDNFYTVSAVCTPSRGCFLTGCYPQQHGAYRNGEPLRQELPTVASVLKSSGYDTAYMGKWHLAGESIKDLVPGELTAGFDDSRYMYNIGHPKSIGLGISGEIEQSEAIGDEESFPTDWLSDRALEYIREDREKPFFLQLSIPDPHEPFEVRQPYDTMFKPEEMPVPETFNEREIPDWAENDEWGRSNDSGCYQFSDPHREERLRRNFTQYFGMVKCIDDNVGKILKALKDAGKLDDTIVIFTSDHGDYMGEHGLGAKNQLYDSVYKIPFIIRWGGKFPAGHRTGAYISIVDFQQTLLGLLGLSPTGDEQGRDASAFLKGETLRWRDEIFIHPSDVPRTGIITPEYELAYVGKGWERKQEFSDHILFDRINDPDQKNNLYREDKYKGVIERLTGKIVDHHIAVGTDLGSLPSILHPYFAHAATLYALEVSM